MKLINPHPQERIKTRLGRCYELAGEIVLHNEGAALIHGTIQNFGLPPNPHAWVELSTDSIWEPATNQVWKRDVFTRFFNPRVTVKYDRESALKLMWKHEHYGPWHN